MRVVLSMLALGVLAACDDPGSAGGTVTADASTTSAPDTTTTSAPDATVTTSAPDTTTTTTTSFPTTSTTSGEPDVSEPAPRYYAVSIDDIGIFEDHRSDGGNPCATSSTKAHGADIDAVELYDAGESLGFLDATDYAPGDLCDDLAFNDPWEAEGPPDGDFSGGFVSLAGGRLTGTFYNEPELREDYTIVVYEIGDAFCDDIPACIGDEGYRVTLVGELGCAAHPAGCPPAIPLGENAGEADFVVPAF